MKRLLILPLVLCSPTLWASNALVDCTLQSFNYNTLDVPTANNQTISPLAPKGLTYASTKKALYLIRSNGDVTRVPYGTNQCEMGSTAKSKLVDALKEAWNLVANGPVSSDTDILLKALGACRGIDNADLQAVLNKVERKYAAGATTQSKTPSPPLGNSFGYPAKLPFIVPPPDEPTNPHSQDPPPAVEGSGSHAGQ